MLSVEKALKHRRTIRAFKPDRISRDSIMKIIEPALAAPSWANTQPWEIFVAAGEPLERIRRGYAEKLRNSVPRDPDVAMPKEWPDACRLRMEELKAERMATLGEACRAKGTEPSPDLMQINYRLFDAPVVVYLCMDNCLAPWSLFDLGAMSQSIMLSAEEQGLGSAVAVTLAAHPDIIRKELSIPGQFSIVIGIALGLPDPDHPQNKFKSTRRSAAEVVRLVGV